jgi:hypothetical protein
MSWLGQIRPHRRDEAWPATLWQTFFSVSLGAPIPAIAEKPLAACGCRKFQIDALGDHLGTCTAHSGAKKAHLWAVDHLADLFRTTHRVKTQQVVKSRGQHCGGIELAGYLQNRLGRCLWCWTSALLMSVGDVALTLLLTGTSIILTTEISH